MAIAPTVALAARRFHGPAGVQAYGKYQLAALRTLALVFQYAPRFGTILHAGGHLGIMSVLLAERFDHVYTFEVADDNYAWLAENVASVPQIQATYGALGDGQPVTVIRHKYSAEHHARGPGDVPCFRIDDLPLSALDVLLLDLEGGELVAVQHAQKALQRWQPLVVVEEWPRWMRRYGRQPGEVAQFMATCGYVLRDATRMDLAFVPQRRRSEC